jgi:hypothetical protein
MKNAIVAAVLFLYAVSSAGVVLVEYSCHETGTRGVTVPEPRSCYAPTCEDEDTGEIGRQADPCCDHACCDIDVRVAAPGDQIAGADPDMDAGAGTAAAPLAVAATVGRAPSAPGEHPPAAPFPGFDRPIRI